MSEKKVNTGFKLRPWKADDLESLVKHANNPNIARFLSNAFPNPYTRKDGELFLSKSVADPVRYFAIEIYGEAAGSAGIFPQTDIHSRNAIIGYWLSEKYWGQGIMTQAIKEMVTYGFRTFNIARISASPFSNNMASQKVLQKCGFTLEARLKDAVFKNGIYLDEMVYSIRRC